MYVYILYELGRNICSGKYRFRKPVGFEKIRG